MKLDTTPAPLPVELLATDDQRRLAEALESTRPLPASAIEECIDRIRQLVITTRRELSTPIVRKDFAQ